MKITWLGQAGLLFETNDIKIMIDPYLSNSVVKVNPNNYRRVPVDERFFDITPDVMIFTHNHLDHYDPETVQHFINEDTAITVLAPWSVWNEVKQLGGRKNNYIVFNRKTQWTEKGIRFSAVKAEHSDEYAIGVIIEAEGKIYYVTGDTLYNEMIFDDLPEHIDVVFLPVNGLGNNMNMADAARFCETIGAKAIPMHCGLFDNFDMYAFPYEKKVIPKFYQEIK